MQLGQAGHPDMRLASFLTLSQRLHPALGLDQPRRCTVSLLLWGQNRPLEFPGPRFLWGVCASVLTPIPVHVDRRAPHGPPAAAPASASLHRRSQAAAPSHLAALSPLLANSLVRASNFTKRCAGSSLAHEEARPPCALLSVTSKGVSDRPLITKRTCVTYVVICDLKSSR